MTDEPSTRTWICSARNARPGIRAVSHLAAYSTSSGMSGPRTSPTISAMRKFVVFSGFCSAAVNGTSVAIGCSPACSGPSITRRVPLTSPLTAVGTAMRTVSSPDAPSTTLTQESLAAASELIARPSAPSGAATTVVLSSQTQPGPVTFRVAVVVPSPSKGPKSSLASTLG